MTVAKPASRPNVPHFSSGPCAKRPGWNPQNLKDAALGRSHRAKVGKAKLKLAIELTREVLEVPADYKIGIVPASEFFVALTITMTFIVVLLRGTRRPPWPAFIRATKQAWPDRHPRALFWCRRSFSLKM